MKREERRERREKEQKKEKEEKEEEGEDPTPQYLKMMISHWFLMIFG